MLHVRGTSHHIKLQAVKLEKVQQKLAGETAVQPHTDEKNDTHKQVCKEDSAKEESTIGTEDETVNEKADTDHVGDNDKKTVKQEGMLTETDAVNIQKGDNETDEKPVEKPGILKKSRNTYCAVCQLLFNSNSVRQINFGLRFYVINKNCFLLTFSHLIVILLICYSCIQSYEIHMESEVHKKAVEKCERIKLGLDTKEKLVTEAVCVKDMAENSVQVGISHV